MSGLGSAIFLLVKYRLNFTSANINRGYKLSAFSILLFLPQIIFMEKKTRRTFLFALNAALVTLFIIVWKKLTLRQIELADNKKHIFPYNKNRKVSFYDDYIIANKDEGFIVLSARCTHLGCQINKLENDHLICPCHGSEYNLNGYAIKGPAYKNLQKIKAEISADGKTIEIIG